MNVDFPLNLRGDIVENLLRRNLMAKVYLKE